MRDTRRARPLNHFTVQASKSAPIDYNGRDIRPATSCKPSTEAMKTPAALETIGAKLGRAQSVGHFPTLTAAIQSRNRNEPTTIQRKAPAAWNDRG
jgi:hypothetical protein